MDIFNLSVGALAMTSEAVRTVSDAFDMKIAKARN
jgi:hypothetical protein